MRSEKWEIEKREENRGMEDRIGRSGKEKRWKEGISYGKEE